MPSLSEETKVTISLYTTIILLLSVISMAFAFGGWKRGLEDDYAAVNELSRHNYELIGVHEQRFDSQDITLARIETDVTWIRYEMEKESE